MRALRHLVATAGYRPARARRRCLRQCARLPRRGRENSREADTGVWLSGESSCQYFFSERGAEEQDRGQCPPDRDVERACDDSHRRPRGHRSRRFAPLRARCGRLAHHIPRIGVQEFCRQVRRLGQA